MNTLVPRWDFRGSRVTSPSLGKPLVFPFKLPTNLASDNENHDF